MCKKSGQEGKKKEKRKLILKGSKVSKSKNVTKKEIILKVKKDGIQIRICL